jgi:predicted CoA-binding protein
MPETVIILGASPNRNRFSHKAQLALLANGHTPVPVNPRYEQIDGIQCYPGVRSVQQDIDTVTIYVRADILETMIEDIVHISPKRVIFNPGAESREAANRFESVGIRVQNACTLVLLNIGEYD